MATLLLADAVANARRLGYRELRLLTPVGQARARAFYEREGWRPHGEPRHDPRLGLSLLEMRRAV